MGSSKIVDNGYEDHANGDGVILKDGPAAGEKFLYCRAQTTIVAWVEGQPYLYDSGGHLKS